MAEKIALEEMKCSRVTERAAEQCCEVLGTCCFHNAEHRLSSQQFCQGTVLVPAAKLTKSLTIPNSTLLVATLGGGGRKMSSSHISGGLSNFSDREHSQDILGFYMLCTVRLRIIKCVVINI